MTVCSCSYKKARAVVSSGFIRHEALKYPPKRFSNNAVSPSTLEDTDSHRSHWARREIPLASQCLGWHALTWCI